MVPPRSGGVSKARATSIGTNVNWASGVPHPAALSFHAGCSQQIGLGTSPGASPMNKAAALALGLLALALPARAQTADAFYKGKQIRFIVGTAAGQDYDSWSRLIGRHMTRFIPGNPTFVVENMPGAGHILATNYLFNLAPRDGTVIGMVSRNITEAFMMKLPNVRYD